MSRPSPRPGILGRVMGWVLPASFRREHGQDLLELSTRLVHEARTKEGRLAAARVWIREAASLVRLGWCLRREARAGGTPKRLLSHVSLIDVKLGVRMLARQPMLTLVTVFALAVAIPVGLVPEHFTSAVEAPLPVDEGHRVLALRHRDIEASAERPLPLADFDAWRTEMRSFGELAVTTIRADFNLISQDGQADPVPGAVVTASTFDVLRVPPLLGRTLLPHDERPGGPAVVVVGQDLWESRLGGADDILGSTIRIGGLPHEVVGVMPSDFQFPFRDRLWLPLRQDIIRGTGRTLGSYQVFGRLADGATIEEARAELVSLTLNRRAAGVSDDEIRIVPEIVTFAEGYFQLPSGGFKAVPAYLGVQLLALFLLAVACANVGMLVFAKSVARTSELAVRTALGASRGRVVWQLATEALVFALLAAGLGLLIGHRVSIGFDWLSMWLPYWADLRLRWETVLWAIGLAVLSAVLVSVIPALKVTGTSVQGTLQRAAAQRSGIRFGGVSSALIVADVAIAVGVAGFALGLSDVLTRPVNSAGIETSAFLSAEIRVPRIDPGGAAPSSAEFSERIAATQRELMVRLEEEPGVRSVAVATSLPGMDHAGERVELQGGSTGDDDETLRIVKAGVDIGYFEALQSPILSGRGFGRSDLAEGATSVIVNTDFVEEILAGRNAVGQRFRYIPRNGQEPGPWYEIVGVVGPLGVNEGMPGRDAGVYHPLPPGQIHPIHVAVGLGGNPQAFAGRLRDVVREANPSAIVADVMPLSDVFSFNRFTLDWIKIGAMTLIGILIALSASGIYALMSFTVAQRTREIGIRSALGARTGDVARTVARRSIMQLIIGVLLGLPVAWRLLFELQRDMDRVPGHSPFLLALGVSATVLLGVATLACLVPTRRALRIMPTEAFRSPD